MFRFRSFQRRILFFFLGLLIIIQAVAFLAVNKANITSALTQIKDELLVGGKVFNKVIAVRTDHLFVAARLLSGDFAFKTVFATGDQPTLLSAMDNHRDRIRADIMMLVSPDYKLIADTAHPDAPSARFPFLDLIKAAEQRGEASSTVFIDDRPYQIVVVPLLAPMPVAWICIGFIIDDIMAEDLQTLTTLDVTFERIQSGHPPIILASTLSATMRKALAAAWPKIEWTSDKTASINLEGKEYISLFLSLPKQDHSSVAVVLQHSLDHALIPFYHLQSTLIILFVAGVLLSLAGGILIARTVTRPVRLLLDAACAIEDGNYRHTVTLCQQDELGRLASAFNQMTGAIEVREEQIKHQAYHDNLTDLPNRSFLLQKLIETIPAAQEKNASLALIIMDLNRFKDVNAV
ncbi:MAG: HAMP domain-containing protein, partial [Deltaproteobacteria bacterium]|nr:HAMP domain-containing protein [Deltaproteobacteria bacterium]